MAKCLDCEKLGLNIYAEAEPDESYCEICNMGRDWEDTNNGHFDNCKGFFANKIIKQDVVEAADGYGGLERFNPLGYNVSYSDFGNSLSVSGPGIPDIELSQRIVSMTRGKLNEHIKGLLGPSFTNRDRRNAALASQKGVAAPPKKRLDPVEEVMEQFMNRDKKRR